jgi:hypothetical protein
LARGRLDDIDLWSRSISDKEIIEIYTVSASATSVPKLSTLAIFSLGMIGLATRRFKKQS